MSRGTERNRSSWSEHLCIESSYWFPSLNPGPDLCCQLDPIFLCPWKPDRSRHMFEGPPRFYQTPLPAPLPECLATFNPCTSLPTMLRCLPGLEVPRLLCMQDPSENILMLCIKSCKVFIKSSSALGNHPSITTQGMSFVRTSALRAHCDDIGLVPLGELLQLADGQRHLDQRLEAILGIHRVLRFVFAVFLDVKPDSRTRRSSTGQTEDDPGAVCELDVQTWRCDLSLSFR